MSQMNKVCPICKVLSPMDVMQAFCTSCTAAVNPTGSLHKRRVVMDTTTKVCTRCNQAKSRADFYTNSRNADGLLSHCKECHRGVTQTCADKRIIKNKTTTADVDSLKFCKDCKRLQSVTMFTKNSYSQDGYSYSCRACRANKVLKKDVNTPNYDDLGRKFCSCCNLYKDVPNFTVYQSGKVAKYCNDCNRFSKNGRKTSSTTKTERERIYNTSLDTLFQQLGASKPTLVKPTTAPLINS